ncbi:MAG TPA: carboxypeptidase-like regulatory domain-containing protein, partial [Puia sp.]
MSGLNKWFSYFVLLLLLFSMQEAVAQQKLLRGVILDAQSGERVPFASMRFLQSGNGKLSDSAGNFVFRFENWPKDTLEITYVGFQNYHLVLSDSLFRRYRKDSISVVIQLQRGRYNNEVVVSRKVDFGLLLWRKIVRRKKFNDRYRFDNFSYELYNKLELDLNKVNKDKLESIRLLRPFDFVLNNIDSSEDHPFLPIYVTETLSDYYYQRSPLKRREVILGSKTVGLDNESVSKFLGGMDQNIDFYNNFIP